jgi:hypothetical protein
MSTPDARLRAYLEDHFAGATSAIELLRHAEQRWEDDEAGPFLSALLAEVEADQAALERVMGRINHDPSRLKNAGGQLSGRLLALRERAADDRLALLEVLETILLGVRGKRALWAALRELAPADGRLAGTDFAALDQRAEEQLGQIEAHRLTAARAAFLEAGGG